jgi:HTH-type transcriptional regulator, transcriptional repressor of NAD biosynthesis genes
MLNGFVFGKFLPFHKGHQAMISFALTKCDVLTVLVCCSDKESIPCEKRQSWILQTFPELTALQVRTFRYKESKLPNTSETSFEVSKMWSEIFKRLLPDCDLVITSEEYGKYVASFMGIEHIPFDPDKKLFPVSATVIRNDPFNNWQFLPDVVKPYFAIKVAILGTESTGKTTLTERLSKHFDCSSVFEAGRDLIPDSKAFEYNDLYLVASEHAKRIEKATQGNSPLVIIDTDIHITKSYAKFIFEMDLEVDSSITDFNKADLYIYLNNDVEYTQDGTRLSIIDRNKLDISHRETLKRHHIEFVDITGDWEQRFGRAVALINELVSRKSNKQ